MTGSRKGHPHTFREYDDVFVSAVVGGWCVTGNVHPSDAVEIVRRMAARGHSDGQIAHRLNCWRRTVMRIRTRNNIPPALIRGSNQLLTSAPSAR